MKCEKQQDFSEKSTKNYLWVFLTFRLKSPSPNQMWLVPKRMCISMQLTFRNHFHFTLSMFIIPLIIIRVSPLELHLFINKIHQVFLMCLHFYQCKVLFCLLSNKCILNKARPKVVVVALNRQKLVFMYQGQV